MPYLRSSWVMPEGLKKTLPTKRAFVSDSITFATAYRKLTNDLRNEVIQRESSRLERRLTHCLLVLEQITQKVIFLYQSWRCFLKVSFHWYDACIGIYGIVGLDYIVSREVAKLFLRFFNQKGLKGSEENCAITVNVIAYSNMSLIKYKECVPGGKCSLTRICFKRNAN